MPPVISYQQSVVQTLKSNFDSFKKNATVDEEPAKSQRIIPRDYFPPSGKFSPEFGLKVRDELVTKKAQDEIQSNRRSTEDVDDMLRKEIANRENLRKEVRNFAVKKIHVQYRDVFHAVWEDVRDAICNDGIKTKKQLNSIEEIEAWLDWALGVSVSSGREDLFVDLIRVIGLVIYSFKSVNRWEVIQETAFMQENNISYATITGSKGCIAKCINDQKSEQNKRIQDIVKRYECNLTSRKSKEDVGDKKRPGSCDFYVGNGLVKRTKKDQDSEDTVSYVLVSFGNETGESTSKRKCRYNFDDPNHSNDHVDAGTVQPMEPENSDLVDYNVIIAKLVSERIQYMFKADLAESTRVYWQRKLLQFVLTLPCDKEVHEVYQRLIDKFLPSEKESVAPNIECIDVSCDDDTVSVRCIYLIIDHVC